MIFSREELILINEALVKAKAQSMTDGFEIEKKILDSFYNSPSENFCANVHRLYDQLNKKIEKAIKEMKNA